MEFLRLRLRMMNRSMAYHCRTKDSHRAGHVFVQLAFQNSDFRLSFARYSGIVLNVPCDTRESFHGEAFVIYVVSETAIDGF